MRKLFVTLIAVLSVSLLFSSCSKQVHEDNPEEEEIYCAANQILDIQEREYAQTVSIVGDAKAEIVLNHCHFEKGFSFGGKEESLLIVTDTCSFGAGSKITFTSGEKEKSDEDVLPCIITYKPIDVEIVDAGTVLGIHMSEMTVGGETYHLEDCKIAVSPTSGQLETFNKNIQYDSFAYAQWWENGEKIIVTYAAIAPT